jgi:NAD+ kinase
MRIALFGWTIGPIFYDSMNRLVEILNLHQADILVYAPFLEFLQKEAGIDPGEIQVFYSDKELIEVDF